MGEREVVVEVKIAQRDEFRRVVLLSSPVQIKNFTHIDMSIWFAPETYNNSDISITTLKSKDKLFLPLTALYSDETHLIWIQIEKSKPTLLPADDTLSGGSRLVYLAPLDKELWGYCFFVETIAHVRDVYYEQSQNVKDKKASNKTIESGKRKSKYQIRIFPCLSFENTLPIRLQYQLMLRTTLIRSGTLSPGEDVAFHEFDSDSFLRLRLPSSDSEWTQPIPFANCITRDAKKISEHQIVKPDPPDVRSKDLAISFYSKVTESTFVFKNKISERHLFTALIDFTVADNGSPRIVIYAKLWLYNQSHVPEIIFRDHDAKYTNVMTTASKIIPDRPIPTLMNCSSQAFEVATIYDNEISQWSEKFRATTVGILGSTTLKARKGSQSNKRHNIGIAIRRPSGRFHRSTQIIISARYGFVNHTQIEFEVRQVAAGISHGLSTILVPAHKKSSFVPFDLENRFSHSISIRPRIRGSKWSGPINIENEREFPLRLRGIYNMWKSIDSNETQRIRVRIGSTGASIVIDISEDIPPLLIIQNNSSYNFEFRQAGSHEKLDILDSGKSMSYGWDKPEGICKVLGRFRGTLNDDNIKVSRIHRYDFEQLDRDNGSITFWMHGGKSKLIAAEVIVQGLSRVLRFSDETEQLKTKFILDINIIALRRFPKLGEDTSNCPKPGEIFSYISIVSGSEMKFTEEATLLRHQLYRYDYAETLYFTSRPREMYLNFYECSQPKHLNNFRDFNAKQMNSVPIYTPKNNSSPMQHFSAFKEESYHEPQIQRNNESTRIYSEVKNSFNDVSNNDDIFYDEDVIPQEHIESEATGSVHIKLPKNAWTLSHASQKSMNDLQGYWWDVFSPEGTVIGQVQIVLKHRTSNRLEDPKGSSGWIRAVIPSIGISFVHNTYKIEVAYFTMQRVHLLWCQKAESNEIALAIGNVQLDNQIDSKVVLGPKLFDKRDGVRVRLRDRWKNFVNYGNRMFLQQANHLNVNTIQCRILWNSGSNSGITHVELVELIMQPLEVHTDEKFVVNLISVFQGLENLITQKSFNEIVNQNIDQLDEANPISQYIYIERLDLESVKIGFSLELNGGRHIAKLGPSGRRLAVYLPESNVTNLNLVFTRLVFNHVYGQRDNILDQLYRHYQQHAVLMILRYLHTVTVYINPFRIVYRLGNGFLSVFRDPARGLASGSPVEVLSGAYLGVRSLAVNTISASYETFAGVSGFMAIAVGSFLPDHKRKIFQEDMVNFQRNIMDEVDALEAVEEKQMTKIIIRAPRVFDENGIGLLTEYGPGSLPKEEQNRVDFNAAITIQGWWRRLRLISALYETSSKLRPEKEIEQSQHCLIQ